MYLTDLIVSTFFDVPYTIWFGKILGVSILKGLKRKSLLSHCV